MEERWGSAYFPSLPPGEHRICALLCLPAFEHLMMAVKFCPQGPSRCQPVPSIPSPLAPPLVTLEFCQDPAINEATRVGHMLSLTFLANIFKTEQWLMLQQKSVAEPEMESRFPTSVTLYLSKVQVWD